MQDVGARGGCKMSGGGRGAGVQDVGCSMLGAGARWVQGQQEQEQVCGSLVRRHMPQADGSSCGLPLMHLVLSVEVPAAS